MEENPRPNLNPRGCCKVWLLFSSSFKIQSPPYTRQLINARHDWGSRQNRKPRRDNVIKVLPRARAISFKLKTFRSRERDSQRHFHEQVVGLTEDLPHWSPCSKYRQNTQLPFCWHMERVRGLSYPKGFSSIWHPIPNLLMSPLSCFFFFFHQSTISDFFFLYLSARCGQLHFVTLKKKIMILTR